MLGHPLAASYNEMEEPTQENNVVDFPIQRRRTRQTSREFFSPYAMINGQAFREFERRIEQLEPLVGSLIQIFNKIDNGKSNNTNEKQRTK